MHKMQPVKHRKDATKVQLEPQVPKVLRCVAFGEAQGAKVVGIQMKNDMKKVPGSNRASGKVRFYTATCTIL